MVVVCGQLRLKTFKQTVFPNVHSHQRSKIKALDKEKNTNTGIIIGYES